MPVATPTDSKPELFTAVEDVETPALVVDLDVMERNLESYAAFADAYGVQLRSHAKTHKTPDLAHRQHRRTGGGILCQTLSEAEVMALNGIDDIYLSYMVVEPSKLDRLVWLVRRLDSFATTVDSRGNVDPVQQAAARHGVTIDVVLELDVGLNRVGVTCEDDAVELATYIDDQPNLRLTGVMAYEGHLGYEEDIETEGELEEACLATMEETAETVEAIQAAGVPVSEVKVGSTATSRYSGKHPAVTEINPGMYLFNDGHLIDAAPHVERSDCALTVLTTVLSVPAPDRAVVDAGSKSISPDVDTPPLPVSPDGPRYDRASEEHGWLTADGGGHGLAVGEKLSFIPPHVCTTVNLHETIVGVRDGVVEEVWAIEGRGKVK